MRKNIFKIIIILKVITGKPASSQYSHFVAGGIVLEHSLSLTGRCSSLSLLKKTLRGVRPRPGLLPSLLLLRTVCGTSETAVSFYHQGEEEDEDEEEERKMRQTTAASAAAVSLRIGAYGLLRAVT